MPNIEKLLDRINACHNPIATLAGLTILVGEIKGIDPAVTLKVVRDLYEDHEKEVAE